MSINAVNTLEILVPPGAAALLEGCIARAAGQLRATTGCIAYDLVRGVGQPSLWILSGYWASQDDMDAHLAGDELEGLVQLLVRYSAHLHFATFSNLSAGSGHDGFR